MNVFLIYTIIGCIIGILLYVFFYEIIDKIKNTKFEKEWLIKHKEFLKWLTKNE